MTNNNKTEKGKVLEYAFLSTIKTLDGQRGRSSTKTEKKLVELREELGMSHIEIMDEAITASGFPAPSEPGHLLPN